MDFVEEKAAEYNFLKTIGEQEENENVELDVLLKKLESSREQQRTGTKQYNATEYENDQITSLKKMISCLMK